MSDPKSLRNWLPSWLHSGNVTTAKPFTTLRRTRSLHPPLTKPVDIQVSLLQNQRTVKDCFYQPRKSPTTTFVPIQRLDSTGGVETEQSRFSYPPARKNIDEYLMGNILHNQRLRSQNTRNFDLPKLTPVSQASPTTGLFRMGSYLVSSLKQITNNFTSLPDLDTAGILQPSFHNSDMPISKATTMQTCHDSVTNCMSIPFMSTIKTAMNCKNNAADTGNKITMDFDPSKNEITIMSPECFKEVQMHQNESLLDNERTNFPPQQSCDVKQVNDHISTPAENEKTLPDMSEKCNSNNLCATACKNPLIARILGYESDCESERNSSTSVECDDSSLTNPEDSDVDEIDQINSDSEEVDNVESTDTEDEHCPWDRIVSCRIPWTCARNRRPSRPRRISSSSDYDTDSSDSSDDCDVTNHCDVNNGENVHDNEIPSRSWTDQSIDSCFEENEFPSYSTDDENTVKRPMCSNSDISFILGWSNSQSDSENEDVFSECSDDEEITFLTSDKCEDARNSNDPATPNTPTTNDSCQLWDYFMKCRDPYLNITTETNNLKKSSRQLRQCDGTDVDTGNKNPKETEKCEDSFYKAPTKVRFSDKVVIHPMIAWSYAYRHARKGSWDCCARDRDRFKSRISTTDRDISWCLKPSHREEIYQARFF